MVRGGYRKQLREEIDILTEQWGMLVGDAKRLIRRMRLTSPTEAQIEILKQDFSQRLTADSKEIDQWLREHPLQEYRYARLEWLEGFHMAIGEMDDLSQDGPNFSTPRQVEAYPWWSWYATLRGIPPADFPAHLSWRVCLHRKWLTIR